MVGGVIAHNLGHNCQKARFIGGQVFQVYSKVIQIYIHTHTHPFLDCFHYTLLQDIEYSFLCYTVGCLFSIYQCVSVSKGLPSWLSGKKIHLPVQELQETWVSSLGGEDPLEKEMAIHCSILAWEISWTEEPGRLQFMGLQESDTIQ